MKSSRRSKPLSIAFWLAGGLLTLILVNVIGQGLSTLDRLTFVERERDRWQRAGAIVAELQLRQGSRVADVGCGAGYFALKLSDAVGQSGSVQAVDILRLPLVFLKIRALQQGRHNIHVILGEPNDPHLHDPHLHDPHPHEPPLDAPHFSGTLDAALLANTYHELSRPGTILKHLHQSLVSGGRLVITDRGAGSANAGHAIDPSVVELELRRDGFEILNRHDHFLDQPGEGAWWLITAIRPYNEGKI